MRRERERNGRRGWDIGITAMFLRSAKTWWDCYYQSPRLRYGAVSRQPSYPIKVYWICRSRNFWKAAVASPSYMSSVAKVRFFLHIPTHFWKYLKDSSEIICLRVQHYWFNLRVSVSSVWGSRFAPGVCQWWRGVGCPHWSPPRCCPSAVPHLPPFAVPLDDKRRMRGWLLGERDILLCSSSD